MEVEIELRVRIERETFGVVGGAAGFWGAANFGAERLRAFDLRAKRFELNGRVGVVWVDESLVSLPGAN